jgi:hypothetical protein
MVERVWNDYGFIHYAVNASIHFYYRGVKIFSSILFFGLDGYSLKMLFGTVDVGVLSFC